MCSCVLFDVERWPFREVALAQLCYDGLVVTVDSAHGESSPGYVGDRAAERDHEAHDDNKGV